MKIIHAAALALSVSAPAFAANPVTLDFEGAVGYANPIANYYNGGTDSAGHSGTNYGVSFTDALVGLSNDPVDPLNPGFQYFSHSPSNSTAVFAFDSSAFMNVVGGFVDTFSFYYSSGAATARAVNVYSGLNGGGSLLASFNLLGNATAGGCSDTSYCHFDLASASFAGVGRSVGFGGNASDVVFDNITFTAAVPEPSTYALFGAGLLALAVAKRRRQR